MSGTTRDRWDERYDQDDYFYGTEPNDFLREAASFITGSDVISIADGEGRNGVFLSEQGYKVTSMDGSEVAGRKARALAADRGVRLAVERGDLQSYDLGSERWDAIVSIFVHFPSDERRALHRRIVTALRPGGVVILEAYTPEQLAYGTGGPSSEEYLMKLADLESDFRGLRLEVAREVVRDVIEGDGHRGTSAVVQLVGRKPERE
jgi:SAM-dependent methyltransferase